VKKNKQDINIGIALWNLNAKNLAEKIARISDWGFNCVSFLGGYFEDEFVEGIAKIIRDRKLKVTFHLSFFGKNKERALKDLRKRIARIRKILKDGRIEKNAKYICFDPAYFYSRETKEVTIDYDTTIKALRWVDGKMKGMNFGVENWTLNSASEDMKRIKKGIGKAKTGMLLDLGHLNIAKRKGIIKEKSYLEYFKALPFKIIEIHVHDNDGETDLHYPPGAGNTEYREIFKALKASGKTNKDTIVTFEIIPKMKSMKISDRKKMAVVLKAKKMIERLAR